jgi:hypothetical protein
MRTPANLVALVLAALGVIVLLAAIGYANSVIGFVGFVSVGLLLLGGGMAISNSTPKKTCPLLLRVGQL